MVAQRHLEKHHCRQLVPRAQMKQGLRRRSLSVSRPISSGPMVSTMVAKVRTLAMPSLPSIRHRIGCATT